MSAALSAPAMPVTADVGRAAEQADVRLGLQPDVRIRLASVVRSAGFEERVVEPGALAEVELPNVPWMKDGPALLPSAVTRAHLASTKSSSAGAEGVVGEQVEVVALEERQDRDGVALAPGLAVAADDAADRARSRSARRSAEPACRRRRRYRCN